MNAKEKMILWLCSKKRTTKGITEVATLGAKYGISGATVYRIWRNNKELCK